MNNMDKPSEQLLVAKLLLEIEVDPVSSSQLAPAPLELSRMCPGALGAPCPSPPILYVL